MENQNINDEVISLRKLMTVLRKRWHVVISISLVCLLITGIINYFFLPQIYESKVVLLAAQVANEAPEKEALPNEEGLKKLMGSLPKLPEMTIKTYINQLKGGAVLRKVIQKLNLNPAEYNEDQLRDSIQVAAVEGTNLIEVRVADKKPGTAVQIADTLTKQFLEFITDTNTERVNKSIEFLNNQSEIVGRDLKKASDKLNNLEGQPRSVSVLEQLVAVKSEDLSKYQSRLIQANMEYKQLSVGKRQVEKQLRSTPPIITTTKKETGTTVPKADPTIPPGVSGSAGVEVNPVTTKTEEVNPVFTELKALSNTQTVQVAEKQAEVQGVKAIINQLNEELKSLQAELSKKKGEMDTARKEVTRFEATASLLRGKIDENNISRALRLGETSLVVVSPPSLPRVPVKPNKLLNMGAGLVVGLIFSMIVVSVLTYIDYTIGDFKHAEELLGLPVLGQIPVYKMNKSQNYKEVT